jgi:hypothetical protein
MIDCAPSEECEGALLWLDRTSVDGHEECSLEEMDERER